MINTMCSISRNYNGKVFIQINNITKNNKTEMVSYCEYLNISEKDCKELAITLSYGLTYTEYENEKYYIQRFSNGKLIKEYKDE